MLSKAAGNLLGSIGNTPIVQLHRAVENCRPNVYAKLEFMNPGGSIKDRIALYMIEKAERKGLLKQGYTIVENSSGNTAIGLAMVALQKGYGAKIIMRDSTSREKIEIVKNLGAEVILVNSRLDPGHPDSYNNITPRIVKETADCYFPDQHNNLDNNEAHYMTTGPEIYRQMDGKIDCFIAGIGTGGTVCGAGRYLKEMNPGIKVIAVDVKGSIFYDYFHYKKIVKSERYFLEGLGDEFLIKCPQFEYIDEMLQVTDSQAFHWTRILAEKEGIIAGGSSGAVMWAVNEASKKMDSKANIVAIIADSGYRYMRTIYNDDWLKENNLL